MEKQSRQKTPEKDALEHIVSCRDKPFLEERFIDSFKGRGVFTHKTIKPSTFVVEYRGKIFSHKDNRPQKRCGDSLKGFLYKFSWDGGLWCVDASKEDKSLGRLVNDDHISPNCEMKKIVCEGKPHLCLFAVEKISPGEEITYNYGGSSYPWRSEESCAGSSTSKRDFYPPSSTPRKGKVGKFCPDDDDGDNLPGPSHRVASVRTQRDSRDSSRNSSLERAGRSKLPLDDTSSTLQEDDSAPGTDNEDADESYDPTEAKPKDRNTPFTSKNYCYVCGKGMTKIARHLLRHIDEEPDIAKAFALPKKSRERKKLLNILRNRGNFKHNQEVLMHKTGALKVKRRPSAKTKCDKPCVTCPYCKGTFNPQDVCRHISKCAKTHSETERKQTGGESEIPLAASPFLKKLPPDVWQTLSKLKPDEVAFVVQKDYLLIQLAQSLSKKYGSDPTKHDYITQRLREMGRLLLALYEKSIFSFEDAIKPRNFSKLVAAVKNITGFNVKTQIYNKPSLVLKLEKSLKQIGNIVLTWDGNDDNTVRDTHKFMKLCEERWTKLASQTADMSLSGRNVNSPSTIPFTRDVQALYRYLEKTAASATESMKTCESPQVYNSLCRVTLAQASVLNKCAPEVSKMTLHSFQESGDTTQVLSKHFIRINILSRTSQNVAVLLTSQLVCAIKLLVSKRLACGVHEDNLFLFAKPDSSPTSLYHGGNCVRAFSSLCRAKNPEHLRSVHLHKHTARIFQILNLENDELDHLAKLLGHDIRTDRDYYRSPEAAVELAKIAKLLLAMEKGSLERFKGNSLEEIEIEDELELDVEQSNPGNTDAGEQHEESVLLQQSEDVEQQDRQLTPEQDALEHIQAGKDKPFLEERCIDSFKGRGVFTQKSIQPSSFVVEYRGNLLPRKQTEIKKCGDALNNYLFDFSWNGTNWRIDASAEDGTLGRLVNDDHRSPNCKVKKVIYEGKPHLCLFALKKINPGEEITCNYGDSSYPWRSMETSEEMNTSTTDLNAVASSSVDERVDYSAEVSSFSESFSDEDYVCDEEPNSDDSFTSNNNQRGSDSSKQPTDTLSIRQEDTFHQSSDDSDSDGERKGPGCTNKNYCYVCGNPQSKISRHLFTHRKDEPEIAEVYALRRNSKERKKRLAMLRKRGNYEHNQEVLKSRSGVLKVRKKSDVFDPKKVGTCIYCKMMYRRCTIWRHMMNCPSKKFSNPLPAGKTQILTLVAATGLTDPQQISSGVKKMLKKLKKDEVGAVIWKDPYILQLAQCLYYIKDRSKTNQTEIKQKLRNLARLLLTLKKKSIHSFEEVLKPQLFGDIVEAVREIAGFDEEKKLYNRQYCAVHLGYAIKKLADIKYARALKEEADEETVREAETFMKLCQQEWPTNTSQISKAPCPATVPFMLDVQLFFQCLENTRASAMQTLTMYESAPVYNALLKVTLAHLSILNNKKGMEVSKVTLESFKQRAAAEPQEDAAVCPLQFEQILSKNFMKINVVTTNGKKLALTLTPDLLAALTLLAEKRERCGVHENNPFLFGRPANNSDTFSPSVRCIGTFVGRSEVKNQESLRSVFFHKHIVRIFKILCLTNDELEQLAKLLGFNIRTDQEYYRTEEAAADIAKILVILMATESGCLERFKGKSLEEIEIPDNLQPDIDPNTPENSDAEEHNEESENSHLHSGSKGRKVSSSKKRSRRKKQETEEEKTEVNPEAADEANTEKDDKLDEAPATCDVNTPEQPPSRSKEDESNIYFSDDDEDMNVDFDMDIDTDDDAGNGENDKDGKDVRTEGKDGSDGAVKDTEHSSDEDLEDTMDIDTEDRVEEKDSEKDEDEEHSDMMDMMDMMDEDSNGSSAILTAEKKSNLSAALIGLKEVKILIQKLDIERMQAPIHISQFSSLLSAKDHPTQDDVKRPTPTEVTDEVTDERSNAKAMQMTCSHCKHSMLKGQTAYQKKGFTDVFCSKNCLFEMFPVNKPASRACYYCLKAILRPLDLIMAAVDNKGTMKDFCSPACLCSFKYDSVSIQTSQSLCSRCNKSCTTTCELTLNEVVHKFCSDTCLEGFCRDNVGVCENCSSTCSKKPLTLKLDDNSKIICGEECLEEFKKKIKTPQQCPTCRATQPGSNMVSYKINQDLVKLFCSRTCVASYKIQLDLLPGFQEKLSAAQLEKRSKEQLNTEQVKVGSDSTETDSSSRAKPDTLGTLTIADSCVVCCSCGKKLPKGQTLYQTKNSLKVFCSSSCLSEKHPNVNLVPKKCYNCFQVILRPHNIILAPVDDSGTRKELCSDACLASVKSKRNKAAGKRPSSVEPRSECKMCIRYCNCKYKLTLDGLVYRLCSDKCYINYHKVNNLPLHICDFCGSVCHDKRLGLNSEEGSKTVCSDECLVKIKQMVETRRLCPTCQTSHQMSDMVESKSEDGGLDLFCSNRCMMVYKAQTLTLIEKRSPSPEVEDIKEVKPSLLNLHCIKEEPIDEEYSQNLAPSLSALDIKNEQNVGKEDLQISSFFSMTRDSTPTEPTVAHMDVSASCSTCKNVLMDGATVYQKKGCTDIFCCTSCLVAFYQVKPVTKTCHYCLEVITNPQDVLWAPVDDEGTEKDFCSQICLSSFNYKRNVSTKIPFVPVASHSQCSMCNRYCICKHEITHQGMNQKICNDSCYRRFCNMNKLLVCENCRSCCNSPLTLKVDDGKKALCSTGCLVQFKQKIQTPQPCSMCCTSKLMSDMAENKNSEDMVELFCSSSCVMASKIQAVSASGARFNCDNCDKTIVPACHLAMPDASIRNFCSLSCAMAFKEKQKDVTAATNSAGTSVQTQSDFHKLPCAQCQKIIKTKPKVIQNKEKRTFVCSLACSQEFKRIENITGVCEYCKNDKIIKEVKRIDGRDCNFCSDGCKTLLCDDLAKKWGQPCHLCAYCLSITKTVVKGKGSDKVFCSEDCSSNHKMLLSDMAKCDTCGCSGKLKQNLPLVGEVKHFCNLKCLLHFCNEKVPMVQTVSSPAGCSGAAESLPVIANVVSLASALAEYNRAKARSKLLAANTANVKDAAAGSTQVTDIQTKVVGHASVQTVPKELKNKSLLCTPLVHNKGVSCAAQTVEAEVQTENVAPKVTILPVPVPVYVPVPMNMYSQYTPTPAGLPLPLPVPVFLPVTSESSEPTMDSTKKRMQPEPFEGDLNFKPETETDQVDGSKGERRQKDRDVTKVEETLPIKDTSDSHSDDSDADYQPAFSSREESSCDASFKSLSRSQVHKTPPPVSPSCSLTEVPPPPALEDAQNSPSSPPAPPLLQQTLGKVHNWNKACTLQQSQVMSREQHKLKTRCGVDAWKRWIQWRESQTHLGPVSSHAGKLKSDILRCSATELSDGLCRFISEVKQPDGEPYSPDRLFYICLAIQQYLFDNDRVENIFSDVIYNRFSTQFTKILKHFRPSVSASGSIRSCVEEEFLWECKQLGAYSPIVLLNTLLFFCCKYFGFTTAQQHRQLSFTRLTLYTKTNHNNTKTTFLRFYPPTSSDEAQSDTDGVPAKKRKKNESRDNFLEMMENPQNSLRCPVRLYEFYLSKCSESVKQRGDLFYLLPHRHCAPSSLLWFLPTPLDDGTMEAMIVRTLAVRELQGED